MAASFRTLAPPVLIFLKRYTRGLSADQNIRLDRRRRLPIISSRGGVMKRFAVLALAALLAACASLSPIGSRQRVVLQVSDADPAKWNLALNNARNIQQDLGKDKVDIEIVAYGPGIGMLKAESKVAGRLAQALDNDIGLMACENTMRNNKIEKADMYAGIRYVDAGVVHIMKREREGWAYVRP
jgi:intracellular sulfur oxidation DsrE/DsrF family protein